MREIKFRAWAGNKMVFGPTDDNPQPSWVLILANAHDFPLMQFTGLKDKNGREIYEGDIVHHSYFHEDGIMAFHSPCSAFMLEYSDGKHQEMYPIDSECFEVIGNIYENPELLPSVERGRK